MKKIAFVLTVVLMATGVNAGSNNPGTVEPDVVAEKTESFGCQGQG